MAKRKTCTDECVECAVCGETCHSTADGCTTVSSNSGSAECAEFWNMDTDESFGVCHGDCGMNDGRLALA